MMDVNSEKPAGQEPADRAGLDSQIQNQEKPDGGNGAAGNGEKPDGGNGGTDDGMEQPSPDDLPITDFGKVDLGLPEDADIDQAALSSFGEQAKQLGLSPKQARGLVKWQLELAKSAQDELMEAGAAELAKDWGNRGKANQQAVLGLISRIDRKLGNDSFSRALDKCGATCHAAVCKGLLAIASMLSEDSTGPGNGPAVPQKPETALEGIENAFREMRNKS